MCVLTFAIHFNLARVEAGSTVAVFGCGAVGLAAIMGCVEAGASRILAIDINPAKWSKGLSIHVFVEHMLKDLGL